MSTTNVPVGFQHMIRTIQLVCVVVPALKLVMVGGCDFVMTDEPFGKPVEVKDLRDLEGVWKDCPENDEDDKQSNTEVDIFGEVNDALDDEPDSKLKQQFDSIFFVRAVGPGELTVGKTFWDKDKKDFGTLSARLFVRSLGDVRILFLTEPGADGYVFLQLVNDRDGTLKLCEPNFATFNEAMTDGVIDGKVVSESSNFGLFRMRTIQMTLDEISMKKLLKEKGLEGCFNTEASATLQRLNE